MLAISAVVTTERIAGIITALGGLITAVAALVTATRASRRVDQIESRLDREPELAGRDAPMTNYAADAPTTAGTVVTQKSGTASSDAVPAGCTLLLQNTGAGAHNVDVAIGFTYDGLSPGSAATPGKRRINITAGQFLLVLVRPDAGDANNLCGLTIDGTASEVKYWVMA